MPLELLSRTESTLKGPHMTEPAVVLEDASVSYQNGRWPVIQDVSLEIGADEFVSIVGPSGCGKTTLLKVVAGLVPYTGDARVFGKRPDELHREHAFGFAFQEPNLLPWRTVRGNALLLTEAAGIPKATAARRVDDLLEAVDLREVAGFYPHQLSGGMRHRTSIVRTLAIEPRILLMDEPFAALDAMTRDSMGELLMGIWGGDRPVLFVTHSIPEAVFLSDRVIVMSARPARIVELVRIDLARPRTFSTREDPAYISYVNTIARVLRTTIKPGGEAAPA